MGNKLKAERLCLESKTDLRQAIFRVAVPDVVTRAKFGDHRFRGFGDNGRGSNFPHFHWIALTYAVVLKTLFNGCLRFQVNSDGIISFGGSITWYTPRVLPVSSAAFIAVYWADVDTRRNDGRVYYRQVTGK